MYKRPYDIISSKKTMVGMFQIIQDSILINQNTKPYSYVDIKNGVCILPFVSDKLVLIQQYRHAMDNWEWELPAGMIEINEKPEEAAIRELAEETGYQVDNINDLGYFYPSPGSTTEKIYLYYAECNGTVNPHTDDLELITTKLISVEKFESMIYENEFRMGAGIVVWEKYKLSMVSKHL